LFHNVTINIITPQFCMNQTMFLNTTCKLIHMLYKLVDSQQKELT
jgi:hypothetical protein